MDDERFDSWLRALGQGMSRRGALAALGGLGLAAIPGFVAGRGKSRRRQAHRARVSAASAPVDVCEPDGCPDFVLPTGDPYCDFPVRLQITGKAKDIELPGLRSISTAPGMNAVLTNLDSGEQISLNITGATHYSHDADGNLVGVATGRNILVDEVALPHFALAIGTFTWTFDADFNLIHPRSGNGQLTNICDLLS